MTDRRHAFATRLRGIVPVRFDEPMAKHTSFRIGGPADIYVQARTLSQLTAAVRAAWELDLPLRMIGGGSNLLVLDGGVRGVVVETRAREVSGWPASSAEHPRQRDVPASAAGDDLLELTVEAGAPLAALARRTAALGWMGLEWAVDVPGTVGGAVVNNAGAHGSDMAHSITAALVLAPNAPPAWWSVDDLRLAYRASALKSAAPLASRPVVLAAKILLRRGDPLTLRTTVAQYSRYRRQTQPVGACAGSMFKNPPEAAAGWLIERAKLKGTQVGGARVSDLHGNFMLNLGGATATDVLRLVELVRQRVLAECGVELELEIEVVGEALP